LASAGTSGSPNTLPISDGAASNGRNRMVIFNDGGDLGGTAYVQLTPNDAEKIIYVRNSLSSSRSILLFQGTYNASNDYEVPAGTTAVIYFDGAGTGAVAANVFNNAYFDSLRLGSVSVTAILDEDNMASDSATALATQQSIKAYVDTQVGANNELSEVLANGNTTGGTDIVVSTGDDITFADSSKAIFGAGSDLQIYHDGSGSRIYENGTGVLAFYSNGSGINFYKGEAAENMLTLSTDGAVTAYYDGSQKLTTTSTGVDITGTLTSDGLTVDGTSPAVATFNSTSNGVRVEFNGASTPASRPWEVGVLNNADGDFYIYQAADAGAGDIKFYTDGVLRKNIDAQTGDISFYEDTGTTAKFFWDADDQRLDLQAVSADAADSTVLRLSQNNFSSGGTTLIKIGTENTTWSKGAIGFERTGDYDTGSLIFCTNNTTSNADVTSADERMRISSDGSCRWTPDGTTQAMTLDASGNLLVGTTDSSVYNNGTNTSADTGINLNTTYAGFARYNGTPVYINRTGSDGDIVTFNKSGAPVGSIGVHTNKVLLTSPTGSNTLALGSTFTDGSSAGLYMYHAANCIIPFKSSDNSLPDGVQSLGHSSYRFKDLYLSGGVYLGGTGSANKLDDYEEGTWTPAATSGITINSIVNATYTKVGRQVTLSAWMKVDITANDFIFGGFPFSISGRTCASVTNPSTDESIANQCLSTSCYGYGADTTGTDDDFFLSLTYDT